MLGFTDAGSLFDYIQKYYYNQDMYELPGRAKVLVDAVGYLSSLLELCETTVVRVCA